MNKRRNRQEDERGAREIRRNRREMSTRGRERGNGGALSWTGKRAKRSTLNEPWNVVYICALMGWL